MDFINIINREGFSMKICLFNNFSSLKEIFDF